MWDAGLRQVYVATHNEQPLRAVLEREAAQLDDDARIPLQLATLASQEKDWGNTEQWAHAALRIDVKLPRAHALLATALFERRAYATALQEFAAAGDKALLPTERLAYAKTLIATGNAAQAKPLVEQLIRTAPDLPGLVDLARELEP
jgi:tetratricopeptide (TPR) repeat protein